MPTSRIRYGCTPSPSEAPGRPNTPHSSRFSSTTHHCPKPHDNFIARLEQQGWRTPAFDDGHWTPAVEVDPFDLPLSAKPTFPVMVTEGQRPVNVTAYPGEAGTGADGRQQSGGLGPF